MAYTSINGTFTYTITNNSSYVFDSTDYAIIQSVFDRWANAIALDARLGAGYTITVSYSVDVLAAGILGGASIQTVGFIGTQTFGNTFPYAGDITLNASYLSAMKNDVRVDGKTSYYYVLLHEVGHILGIGSLWDLTGTPKVSYIDNGITKSYYTGVNGLREYKAYFSANGSSSFVGIPIEDNGGGGTAEVHPEEGPESGVSANNRYINGIFHPGLDTELMTGWLDSTPISTPLSRITLGFLQDMGYIVNYNLADVYIMSWPATTDANNLDKAYVRGYLDVSGTTILRQGTTLGSTLIVNNATTLGNTLAVTGSAAFSGPTSMTSTLAVNNATTIGATLAVTGATTLAGGLAVTGTSTFSGANTMASTLAVTGASTLASTLAVTGASTFSGPSTMSNTLTIVNATTMGSTLFITNATTVGTTLAVTGASTFTGASTHVGTLLANSATTLASTLAVTGATTLAGGLAVTGTSTFSGANTMASTLTVANATTLASTLAVTGASTFVGATTHTGTLLANSATTLATTLAVTGAATLATTLAVTGASALASTLTVANATTLASTFALTGAATLASTLAVTGAATLASTLVVLGNLFAVYPANSIPPSAINGGVGSSNFTTDVSMNAKLYVIGDVSMNAKLSIGGDVSMNSRLYITGPIRQW
jgi:hypothetical protein